MSIESTNKKLALEFLNAFSVGDFDQVLAMLDDEATWWANGTVPGISGRTKKEFAGAIGGIASLSTTGGLPTIVSVSIADGDRVAVEAKTDAKFTNGKVYQNDYVFLFRFVNEKIIEVKEYMDPELARATFLQP